MSGSPSMNVPLFFPLSGEPPHALLEPFGDVEIAVGADREPGRRLELAVDDDARLELPAAALSRGMSKARMLPVPAAPM